MANKRKAGAQPQAKTATRSPRSQPARQASATPATAGRQRLLQLQQVAGNQAVRQMMAPEGIATAVAPQLASDDTPQPGPATQSALRNRGEGQPLPAATQASMEQSLGSDLSDVRLHSNGTAARAADELGAAAFTSGQDIYFGANRYQPGSTPGQALLAHELTHTIQQGAGAADVAESPASSQLRVSQSDEPLEREATAVANRVAAGQPVSPEMISAAGQGAQRLVARQESGETAVPPAAPAAATPESNTATAAPTEEVSLASATFAPSDNLASYLEAQGRGGGQVQVGLGNLARGSLTIRKAGDVYRTTGNSHQPVPLTHPALQPVRDAGVNPVLAVKIHRSAIEGYVTIATRRGAAGNPRALVNWIKEHATEMGWLGMDVSRIPNVTNELSGGVLRLQLTGFRFRLAGFMNGTGDFGLANETVTFSANATVSVPRLTEAQLELSRNDEGGLAGRVEIPVSIANFSGNLIAEYGNGTVNIEGMVGYNAEKFNGEVTLLVTDRETARNVARNELGPDAIAASARETAGGGESGSGPRPGPRALAGYGTVNFAFTEWMTGRAQVIIDNEGHITVIGEIAPPAEVELFPQRDYIRELFTLEVRTLYGVPLVGNVFLFANIGLEAMAKLGPGKIYNIAVRGRYSTDPDVLQNYELEATLNISAFAGLRLRAEGGVGIELLGHDIKAGVGVFALAGIRGYVEATPTIGYRETADPQEGRQGEYFIKGHMEIAAQPFLSLGGDLFVELDSPWWSPAPDKKWTWPLGELEYPLPGEFGIGADVDYVVGSDELPEIQFGEVDFNKDKFMSDLMNDHVPPKSQGEQEQQGEWQQDETTSESGDPALVDSAGAPAADQPAQGRQEPGAGAAPAPDVMQRWGRGMQALGDLAERSKRDAFTEAEIEAALAGLRREHGFTQLRATRIGEDWRVHAAMNPEGDITVEGEGEGRTVEAEGEQFLVFNLPGQTVRIKLNEEEVALPPRMSPLRRVEVLVEQLEIDESTAKALLRRINTVGELLLTFARAQGAQDPLEFLRGRLEAGRVSSAAVAGPVPANIRSKLVYLGEERAPLSDVALVFHEQEPGQFVSRTSPSAGVTEYVYEGGGRGTTATVWPRGIVRVDNRGAIVEILAVHKDLSGGEATFERMLREAGWRIDLEEGGSRE